MPPAASAAVAIRKSRSACSRAAAAASPLADQQGRGLVEGGDADPPGQVQAQLPGDGASQGPGIRQEHRGAGLGHRRHHDDVGRVGGQDVPPVAVEPPAPGRSFGPDAVRAEHPVAALAGGRDRRDHRSVGQQRQPPLLGRAVTGREQHAAGQRGGQERARIQGTAEFAVHHARLDLGQAAAAELPRDRQPGQPELAGQAGMQLGAVAGPGLQRGPQRGRRKLAGQEPAQGVLQGLLVLVERQGVAAGHGCS